MINIDLNLDTQTPFLQNGSRLSLMVNIYKTLLDHKIYGVADLIYEFHHYYRTPKAIRVFMEIFASYISECIPDNITKRSIFSDDISSGFNLLHELSIIEDGNSINDYIVIRDAVINILKERINDWSLSADEMFDSLAIFIYKIIMNKEIRYIANMIKNKELVDKLYSLSGIVND